MFGLGIRLDTAENWKLNVWIVLWDLFLMKKLWKSEIYGSVNSARCTLISWKSFDKSNFAATVHAQCMNSSRNSKTCPKTCEKKKKQEQKKVIASAGPKRALGLKIKIISLLSLFLLLFMVPLHFLVLLIISTNFYLYLRYF